MNRARALGLIDADKANPARWKGHLDRLLPNPKKVGQRRGHHAAMPNFDVPAFMARERRGTEPPRRDDRARGLSRADWRPRHNHRSGGDIAARFGLGNALEVGIATATLGLVVAISLVGGPIAGFLIRRHHLVGPSTPDRWSACRTIRLTGSPTTSTTLPCCARFSSSTSSF